MITTSEKLEEIERNGYQLDFGIALEQSFENYKKIALMSGVVILILLIIFYAVMFGIMGVFIGIGSMTDFISVETKETSFGLTMIISIIVGVLGSALIAPIQAGLLQIAHNAQNYKEFGFSTAFEHYKSSYFKEIVIGSLILGISTRILTSGLQLLGPYIGEITITLVILVISIVITFITFLMIPFIIFGNLKATAAIKGSILLVRKKFLTILLLGIVCFIGGIIGVFGCFIGICFTAPIMISAQYIIYRSAVGIDEDQELDQIGNNFDY